MEVKGYKILHELGSGGMATVYLAEQELLQRQVALKIMAPALAADRVFKERFLVEARIVARLAHPNIIAVYDIGFDQHAGYIAMEYLPGGSLRERLQNGLPPLAVLGILRALAQALSAAHAQGFVHRDIKPQNVLFRSDGSPVLTDFGIAKVLTEGSVGDIRMTQTGMTLGTAAYMSPEQAQANPLDGRSDLYSLGVMFYEMLTGCLPYEGTDALNTALKHLTEPVPLLPQGFQQFQPLLNRMMAKNPNQRFASADALVQAIDDLVEATDAPDAQATIMVPTERQGTSSSRLVVPLQAELLVAHPPFWRSKALWIPLWVLLLVAAGYGGWQYSQRLALQQALAQVQTQIQAGRLIEPMGDNAWETLHQVLAQQPEHPEALQQVEQIRTALIAEARKLQAESHPEAALQALERALPYQQQPLNAALSQLQTALQTASSEVQRAREETRRRAELLQELHTQAIQYLKLKQWVSPPGENVLALYRRVLALQPDDPKALQGVETAIQNGVAQMNVLATQDLPRAGQMLADALAQLPAEPRFLDMRSRLQAQVATKAAVPADKSQIPTLLKQAQTQERSGQWLTPVGNNALTSYRDILALDPEHAEAKAGMERIAAGVKRQIKGKLAQGEPGAALILVRQALAIVPEHTRLRLLLRELQSGNLQADPEPQPQVTQPQVVPRAEELPPRWRERLPPREFERRPPPEGRHDPRFPPPRLPPEDRRL